MDKDVLSYIAKNEDTIRLYVRTNQKLQSSSDFLKPIIPSFLEENKGVNIDGCPECILDMLRWSLKVLKESQKEEPKKK